MDNNFNSKYFIIFSGGGIRGIAYCGVYKALIESGIKISGFAGSSIGAVFASLLSVGYTYEEIYDIALNVGFEKFIDININLMNKTKDVSFLKGKLFYDFIKEKIESKYYGKDYKKGKNEPVRFCDIDSNLIVYSVDITNSKFKEFSKYATPDFEIAKAIRASASMPGLFKPLEIDGNLIVDGDLLKPTPLWWNSNYIKNIDERVIEFRLDDNATPKKIDNSFEYINRVYNVICGFATDYLASMYCDKDKFEYIKINTQDISIVDFLIPKEKKKILYEMGYNDTIKYFREYYPKKRKQISQKYKKLLNLLYKFQKDFCKTNIVNSYVRLCEIFMFLCEEKKYLDIKIYELILDFKNTYTKNYLCTSFFGIKTAIVINKENLSRKLLAIIQAVVDKL